jgi:hypothetical protein
MQVTSAGPCSEVGLNTATNWNVGYSSLPLPRPMGRGHNQQNFKDSNGKPFSDSLARATRSEARIGTFAADYPLARSDIPNNRYAPHAFLFPARTVTHILHRLSTFTTATKIPGDTILVSTWYLGGFLAES